MTGNAKSEVNRRGFLGSLAIAAAAPIAGTPARAAAPEAQEKQAAPSAAQAANETSTPAAEPLYVDNAGSDYMVDVIKSLNIEYVTSLAGSTFRGLHESLINYGGNTKPEFITCLHEEGSVGMAHGYAKVAGKPIAPLVHGTVGLQHASMAVYNAWCDRVPMVILVGNVADATQRRPGVEWVHSMQDNGLIVRDCTKWDDQPASLGHFGESLVRAYRIAMTPPMGPVMLVADGDLQEHSVEGTRPAIPKLTQPVPPQGDSRALAEAAKMLLAADNPVIVADRCVRTAEGMAQLATLAELLGAALIDKFGRLNIASDHELNLTDQAAAVLRDADVVLGIEVGDIWGTVNTLRDVAHRNSRPVTRTDVQLISIGTTDLLGKANYQDFQRYAPVTLAIVGDGEASLPALIDAVRGTPAFRSRANAITSRRAAYRKRHQDARALAQREAVFGWDASPISMARLHGELWPLIQREDWALVSDTNFQSHWPHRTWNFTKPYQYIGAAGGAGVGYSAPAAIGGALAHRPQGRLPIAILGDGELMCVPGALWTAAHHRIPLLSIVHNNRAYHQEVMHVQRMANQRRRGIDRAHIGTVIDDPPIDFAKLAQSMGMEAFGPVETPDDYVAALKKALPIVKSGAPVMIDAICQPR